MDLRILPALRSELSPERAAGIRMDRKQKKLDAYEKGAGGVLTFTNVKAGTVLTITGPAGSGYPHKVTSPRCRQKAPRRVFSAT